VKLLMITGDRALAEGRRGAFYNTLEELHKYFDRIDIICPKVSKLAFNAGDFSNKVKIHSSPWPIIFHPLWILKKGSQILGSDNYDLMTVHEYPPFYNGIGARLLWQKTKIPYILEIHHIPGYPRSSSLKEELYKSLLRMFIELDSKKAKAVRVVNETQVSKFLIESGVPKEKIIYVSSMYIDFNTFRPLNLVKEYDFIFVGRLEKNKGIDLFLETVKNLSCKAIIVGDGPLKKNIELRIKNYGLEKNIIMHGWARDHKEVAELMNKSKILAMTSFNEGGPRVVPEALACGIPVLATRVGIATDLVKSGVTGELADWDAEDIAQKADKILKDYDKYKNSGIELVKQFEKTATIRKYAESLQNLIK
jgi:glycosyltransferase involved in cell wall biosynthesis